MPLFYIKRIFFTSTCIFLRFSKSAFWIWRRQHSAVSHSHWHIVCSCAIYIYMCVCVLNRDLARSTIHLEHFLCTCSKHENNIQVPSNRFRSGHQENIHKSVLGKRQTKLVLDWRYVQEYRWCDLHSKESCRHHRWKLQKKPLQLCSCKRTIFQKLYNIHSDQKRIS